MRHLTDTSLRRFHTALQLAPLGFTKRESEILYWLVHCKANAESATILGLSPHTVRSK